MKPFDICYPKSDSEEEDCDVLLNYDAPGEIRIRVKKSKIDVRFENETEECVEIVLTQKQDKE